MGRIAVAALKPEMTLAAPVFNARRQCLAEAGVVLDARKISLFQAWGVVEVEVQGVIEPSLKNLEEQMAGTLVLQRLSQQIDDRFYGAEPHLFVQELRRLVKKLALDEHGGEKG